MSALGITSVAPSTYIAGYGYGTVQSSLSALAQRIFYQTTNGNIVSAYHSGLTGSPAWVVDTTIATNLPLGTPISAFIDVITASRVVYFQLYFDSHSECFLTASGGSSVHRRQRLSHFYILKFGCGRLEHSYHSPSLIVGSRCSQARFTVSETIPGNWICDISVNLLKLFNFV
jgi:hypothetical protein